MKPTSEKFRISNFQFFLMVIATTVAYGHFIYTHLAFLSTGREAWLSLLIGGAMGISYLYVFLKFVSGHPKKTFDVLIEQAFGRWLGGGISLVYALFFLFIAAITFNEIGLFLNLIYPQTPLGVFMLFEFVLSAWVLRSGIEVMVRCIQLCLPLLILIGICASVMTIKDKNIAKLLPLFDHSALDVWQGSLIYFTMICELVVLGMFVRDTQNPKAIAKQSLFWGSILVLMFLGPAIGPIMMFGEKLAQELSYPTYTEIQYIRATHFIERFDVLGILLWTIGSFLRVNVFLYATLRGVSNLFREKKENTYVFPVVVMGTALSVCLNDASREEIHRFLMTGWPVIAIFFGAVVPFFVWITLTIRQKIA